MLTDVNRGSSSFALDQPGFLSALSQDTRLITMETHLGEEALIVEHFSGQELNHDD
jgi:hypothetical protein